MPLDIETTVRGDVQLRTLLHKYLVANKHEESYVFAFGKGDNQKIYRTYVRERAPKQVNIPAKLRTPLDDQAGAGKWAEMGDNLDAARRSIIGMLNADVMPRFEVSDEYKGYLRSKDKSPAGTVNALLRLPTQKAGQVTGLLKVYDDARTPVDKFLAYEALVKVSGNEALLRAGMRKAGIPVPDPVKKGSPDKALKLFVEDTKIKDAKVKTAMLALLKKYNSASLRSARAKVEADIRVLGAKHSNDRDLVGNMLKVGGWT